MGEAVQIVVKARPLNYFIAQGANIIESFDTFEEMCEYHQSMSSLDRHFCKLYDRKKDRYAGGWAVLFNYDNEKAWSKWSCDRQ